MRWFQGRLIAVLGLTCIAQVKQKVEEKEAEPNPLAACACRCGYISERQWITAFRLLGGLQ